MARWSPFSDTKININFEDDLEIEYFLLSGVQSILAIQTVDVQLELYRLQNVLQRIKKDYEKYNESDYLGSENTSITSWAELKSLIEEHKDTSIELMNLTILQVETYEKHNMEHIVSLKKLFEIISKTDLKKLILIYSDSHVCFKCLKFIKHYENQFLSHKVVDQICFQNLMEGSQKELLNRSCIYFGNKIISLKDFLVPNDLTSESVNTIITSSVLKSIIYPPEKSSSFLDITSGHGDMDTNFYVNRHFHNRIIISSRIRKVLISNFQKPDLFIFSGIGSKKDLINILKVPIKRSKNIQNHENIVTYKSHDDALSLFNDTSCTRSVHLIKLESSGILSWISSKRNVYNLQKFASLDKISTTSETDLLQMRAVIISGPPGAGKSTVLTMISSFVPSAWIIYVDLSLNKKPFEAFKEIHENINNSTAIKFLLNFLDPHYLTSGLLNKYLFKKSERTFYILFDRFENIGNNLDFIQYKNFTMILSFLRENSFAHIWITTERQNRENLENALSTFSSELCMLSPMEQQNVIYNLYAKENTKNYSAWLQHFVEKTYAFPEFYLKCKYLPLGSPLLLKILASLYTPESDIKEYVSVRIDNIGDLFTAFVEHKITAYMNKYFPTTSHKEEIVSYLHMIHGLVATQLLDCQFDELQITKRMFHVDITEVGILFLTDSDLLQFQHPIFAKYFLASTTYKWMCKPEEDLETCLFFDILLHSRNNLVRYFLNQKVKEVKPPEAPKHVIERFIRLWHQRKLDFFNEEKECALHILLKEKLSHLIDWFFPAEFINILLQLFSTRYQLFSTHLLPTILKYTCISELDTNMTLTRRIFTAVRNCSLNDLKKLLSPIDNFLLRVYYSSSHSKTALHLAASLGFHDIVEYLVDVGLPVDIWDTLNATPLQYAASNNQLNIMKFLKEKGSNINNLDKRQNSVLSRCVVKGNLETVKYLFTYPDMNKHILDANQNCPLQKASRAGHLSTVIFLLEERFDINCTDRYSLTPLSWAVKSGHFEIVDLLMSLGASTMCGDQQGRNIIHIAAAANQWHLLKYLIFCSIDVNIHDFNKTTIVERAVKSGKWDIVKYLISQGAHIQVNHQNKFDPVSWAVKAEEWSLVLLMIECGASLKYINLEQQKEILKNIIIEKKSEESLFHRALKLGNARLLELLIQEYNLCGEALDTEIARPYQELIYGGYKLSNKIISFVESKLVEIRYHQGQKWRLSQENIIERKRFICEQIEYLKDKRYVKVSEDHITHLRLIAQNIELLKRYEKKKGIPWEQMEFCLVLFIGFFIKPKPDDFIFKLTLDQNKIIDHLINFSNLLQNLSTSGEYLTNLETDFRLVRDIYSLNRISYYTKLGISIKNLEDEVSPFVLLRCLQVIGEYFKNTDDSPNLSDDVRTYLNSTAPTNVMDIVESLRNSLSHSQSYKAKTKIENRLKSDSKYFQTVQNDLKKIRLHIDFLLYTKKTKTFELFQEKYRESRHSPQRLQQLIQYINWESEEERPFEDYELMDLRVIKKLINKLKRSVNNISQNGHILMNKLSSDINSVEIKVYQTLNRATIDYFNVRWIANSSDNINSLSILRKPKVDLCTSKKEGLYYKATSTVISIISLLQRNDKINEEKLNALTICSQLMCIMKWDTHRINNIQDFDKQLNQMNENIIANACDEIRIRLQEEKKFKFNEHVDRMRQLHIKLKDLNCCNANEHIIAQFDFPKNDFKKLKKSLRENNNQLFRNLLADLNKYGKLLNNCTTSKFPQLLKHLFSSLNDENINSVIDTVTQNNEIHFQKNFLQKLNLLKQIVEQRNKCLHVDYDIQAAIEMLLLDVMEACSAKSALTKYTLSFDEFSPLLVGTSLRNYLAHGTPLIDVLPFEPINAIISTIKILYENQTNLFGSQTKQFANFQLHHPDSQRESQIKLKDYILMKPLSHLRYYEHYLRAASVGNIVLIEQLLNEILISREGQRIPCMRSTLMLWPGVILAAKNQHAHLVKRLLDLIDNGTSQLQIKKEIDIHTYVIISQYLQKYGIEIGKMFDGDNKLLQNKEDRFKYAAFHCSVEEGNEEIVSLFLEKQLSVHVTGKNRLSALHLAVEGGHEGLTKLLLANRAKVNAFLEDLTTPLHMAVFKGYIEAAKILLRAGADVNASREDGCTPIHFAALNGNVEITTLLVKASALVDTVQKDHLTPLHLAAGNNHTETAKFLLKSGANINSKDNKKRTPLVMACIGNHFEMVKLILCQKGSIEIQQDDFSVLHLAAFQGFADIVDLILHSKLITVDQMSEFNTTSLHLASLSGNSKVVEVLLKHKADINTVDKDEYTPLHCAYRHKETVKILLEHGAQINCLTVEGRTALHVASSHGSKEVVLLLLKHKAEVDIPDLINGFTPLHLSAFHGYESVTELLIDERCDVNIKDKYGSTPLNLAAAEGHDSVVNLLLKRNAAVDSQDNNLFTSLHLSAQNNHSSTTRLLLENGANVHLETEFGFTPLHMCTMDGHKNIVRLLLRYGAIVDVVTGTRISPLHHAARIGNVEIVNMLLEKKANPNIKTTDLGLTPLHICSQLGHVEVVELLLLNGAKIDEMTNDQMTPLHLAAQAGHTIVVEILLKFNPQMMQNSPSPLQLAEKNNHWEVVELLRRSYGIDGFTSTKNYYEKIVNLMSGQISLNDPLNNPDELLKLIQSNDITEK